MKVFRKNIMKKNKLNNDELKEFLEDEGAEELIEHMLALATAKKTA